MEYNFFKEVMNVAEQMVLVGAQKEEIKTFFVNRGINATDYQIENFLCNIKSK